MIRFIYTLIKDCLLSDSPGTRMLFNYRCTKKKKKEEKLFETCLKNALNDTVSKASVICFAFGLGVQNSMLLSWFHHYMCFWLYKFPKLTYHWDLSTTLSYKHHYKYGHCSRSMSLLWPMAFNPSLASVFS